MADQKPKPFEESTREVINDELSRVPDEYFRRGSEQFEVAVSRIVTRLATDRENLFNETPEGIAKRNIGYTMHFIESRKKT